MLSRQVKGSLDPLIKFSINNTNDLIKSLGFTFQTNDDYAAPRSYSDIQNIENAPPPANVILGPNSRMGFEYSHNMSDMQTFFNKYHLGSLVQEQVNDVNLQSLSLHIDTDDLQTPLHLKIDFETDGPEEVTGCCKH